MDLSDKIKQTRELKHIKQSEVASALDMDQSYYSRLEKRGNKMTVEQLQKIATVLGVTTAELLTDREQIGNGAKEKELEAQVRQKEELITVLLNRKDYIEEAILWSTVIRMHDYCISAGLMTIDDVESEETYNSFLESESIVISYREAFKHERLINKSIELGIIKSEALRKEYERLQNRRQFMKVVGASPGTQNETGDIR